jgi:hypothetical protein
MIITTAIRVNDELASDGDLDVRTGEVHEHFYLDDRFDGAANVCPIDSCWWNDED